MAVTGGLVGLLTLSAGLIVVQAGVPAQGMLDKIFNLVSRIGSLVIIALVPCLFVIKRRRSLALESNLTLIAILVGFYYLLDLLWSFINFRRSGAPEQGGFVQQTLGAAYAIVFYRALARGPKAPLGALLPTG